MVNNQINVGYRSLRSLLTLVVVPCLFSVACGPTPTAPSQFAQYSQTDLQAGTGAEAVSGSTAGVHYTLWLYDTTKPETKGLQLETSLGGNPFSFRLGANQVIQGWERGVPGMRVGGRRRLVVPPDLAYGDTRNGSVPPNATLVFDIELVSVTTN
jgi:FKBP-type peptidyl-prolyl cis-trans isomerase FkpA